MIDESQLIKTIIMGSDWQEVLTTITIEEGLDPLDVDIVKLTNTFMDYLEKLKKFDFRVPARFILIAAILLNMKCELLLEKEEKELKNLDVEKLDLSAPLLTPPMIRKTTRKVTLDELIKALDKALEIKKKKESLVIRKVDIAEPEDIEEKINEIYDRIRNIGLTTFSDLVPTWKRKDIISTLMPLLYLVQRGLVTCEQEEMFKEIFIRLK